MATDIRKLKDKAQALVLKGKYAKALQMYQKIVEQDPKDLKLWVKIGDLYRKLKRPEQAIEIYAKTVKAFAMSGFLMQAISVSKMILEIDPNHQETQQVLAKLYAKKDGGVPTPAVGGGGKAQGVPAANVALLEKLKKKSGASAVVDASSSKPAPKKEEPAAEVADVAEEDPIEEATVEAVEAPDATPVEDAAIDPLLDDDLDDEEIDLDDISSELSATAMPQFDSLDLDLADDLFDSLMSQEDVEIPIGESKADLSLDSLPNIPLFSSLEMEEFQEVLSMLELRRFDVGDRILREGEASDGFYIIARGSAKIVKKDPEGNELHIADIQEGSFFGEFGFLNDSERHASVVVTQEMEALEIGRAELQKVLEKYPNIANVLVQFYRERLLSSLLAISPLFQPFGDDEKQSLLSEFELKEYDLGSIIIKQGQEGDGLYLILAGQVVVNVKTESGEMHEVALLTEGAFFGEISLIEDVQTTANCIASDDCEIYKLPRNKFKELIMTHPRLLDVVAEFSQKRSEQTKRIVAGGDEALAAAGMV
jgi:CRP-like cAMP-binding protein